MKNKRFWSVLVSVPILLANASIFASTNLTTDLKHLTSYQADFTQTTVANGQIASKASGKVWIQRPWKMRWQVDQPNKQVLLVNGKTLTNINADLNQATVRQMNPTELSNAGLLLASDQDLTHAFAVKTLPVKKGSDIHTYVLTPKQSSQLTEIVLNFAPVGLVSMKTMNTLGQKNIFAFSKINLHSKMDQSLFTFKPAKGMDVLKA